MVEQSCVVTAARENKLWIRFADNRNCLTNASVSTQNCAGQLLLFVPL